VLLPISPRRQDDPTHPQRADAADNAERATAQSGPLASLEGVRALVVDDEADARDLIARILRQSGAEVTVAASAREAMAVLAAQQPDVLLSDIGMPGEDGYALIRQVRALPDAHGGRTPAVALTAFARNEDRKRALAEGFQMHVAKPVEPAELTAAVAELVGGGATTPQSAGAGDVVASPQVE
jgi:CheY-like chemotaxis protein